MNSDAVLETIIQDIVTAANKIKTGRTYIVSDSLAAFVLRSVVMHPKNNFSQVLDNTQVESLVKICVDNITNSNLPQMETVKMQVYFDTHYPSQTDFLLKEKNSRLQACDVILKDITDVKTKNIAIYECIIF